MVGEELFVKYSVKNPELRCLADFAFEAAINVALEQSAGMTIGLNEHAITRIRTHLDALTRRLDSLAGRPILDLPATHPITFECDYTKYFEMIADPMNQERVLNGDAEALVLMFGTFMRELVCSNSAGQASGMQVFDAKRANNNLLAIGQFVDAIEATVEVDFPETAGPAATPQTKKAR